MKRFRFSLARLERVRALERRRARSEAAAALADARRAEQAARDAGAVLDESRSIADPDGDDAAAWRRLAAWREGRRALERRADERRLAALRTADEATHRHAEAARAHRVLERLHQQRRAAWRAEYDTEERKFLDETHLQRRTRDERRSGPFEEDR